MKNVLPSEYKSFWACSNGRKGYSGTAIFVQVKNEKKISKIKDFLDIQNVIYGIGNEEGDLEGRTITIEFENFFIVNTYVPNAGAGLKRLHYRTEAWDKAIVNHLKSLEQNSNGKPVIWGGDLNVAHQNSDFFNPEEKRMEKQAGTTPEERNSFADILSQGYVDTFRLIHPNVSGVYTYFSMRARNRPYNRGLRLDYFLVSNAICNNYSNNDNTSSLQKMKKDDSKAVQVIDSFILDNHEEFDLGDHCPIGLLLAIKIKKKEG